MSTDNAYLLIRDGSAFWSGKSVQACKGEASRVARGERFETNLYEIMCCASGAVVAMADKKPGERFDWRGPQA